MKFAKVQSIGNDFVLVEATNVEGVNLANFARQVCRRHFSIGADGLLVLGKNSDGLVLQMFNPDGTDDFCGNGIRCAIQFAKERGWIECETEILHLGRRVRASIDAEGYISSNIGAASFQPEAVPHVFGREIVDEKVAGIPVSVLSTGSAHAITFVAELPDDELFHRVSPLIENDSLFPERTSLMWTKIESESRLRIRIWERGAGETLGCGTGSLAAAVAWMRKRGFGGTVEVINPGGSVKVQAEAWDSPLAVIGKAQIAYEGELSEAYTLCLNPA